MDSPRKAPPRAAGAFIVVALFAQAYAAACGGESTACVDEDLDGFGLRCAAGDDCDDTNPLRNRDCELVPAPDCAADPLATGCPCLPASTSDCYGADPSTLGVGVCVGGRTLCVHGHWGICEGAILPRGEVCNGADDDCDGVIDEAALSPCGGCTPGCTGGVWGEGDAPFAPAEAGDSTDLTDDGWLTLAREEHITSSVWVANSRERTVSRIDAASATETARYATGGDDPSRVAVDYHDDAWVLNRQFDGTSTLTKIAGSIDHCVDRDGSGSIETSSGPADVLPEGRDECALLTVPVGEIGGVGRALAVDGNLGLDGVSGGDVWVGMHDGMRIVHLDGTTGAELDRVDTPGFSPYAAAFDPWGTLWMISKDGLLLSLNRRASPLEPRIREIPLDCYLAYGLAIDRQGELLITGFSCDQVVRYDPLTDEFTRVTTPPSVRGAVIADREGWVAHTDGRASRLSLFPLRLTQTVDLTALGVTPRETIGAAVDGFGDLWFVSSEAEELAGGVATRVSGATHEVTAQVPVGLRPHTQGDLTGQKRTAAFAPEGTRTHVFEGCRDGSTRWTAIHLGADYGASGSVEVWARHAADRAALATAELVLLGTAPDREPPFPLTVPQGGVLEVTLVLRAAARDGAPRVRRVGVEWSCDGPD